MKRTFAITLLGLILWGAAWFAQAQQPISIAVLHIDGPRRSMNKNITALLTADLSSDPRFSLVDRAELDKILAEQALGRSGNITPDTAAQIGKLTGAQVLVTGREFNGGTPQTGVVIIANVIGAENGRVISHTVQGAFSDLVKVVSELSEKIGQTITNQSASLLPSPGDERSRRLQKIIAAVQGKKLPSVSIQIDESIAGQHGASHVSETELGMIFQKAGFSVVDEKTDRHPDVVITGDAVAGSAEKHGDLVSCPATLQIKAREQATGKILSLDSQRSTASGLGDQTTAKEALANAASELAERLVPALAPSK